MADQQKEKLTKKLQGEIAKVLKSSMPEYVCGVVKDRLEMADQLEKDVDMLSDKLEVANVELKALRDMKYKDETLKERERQTTQGEEDLADKIQKFERNKRVYELEQQLQAQTAISTNAMAINSSLTRNLEYRKNVFGNTPVAVPGFTDQYNNSQPPTVDSAPTNTDETTEIS